jgi:hypothetical protein
MVEVSGAICLQCNVHPTVEDENDDRSVVTCPDCKKVFGTLGEVKAHLQGQLNKAFTDAGWTVTDD